MSDASDPVDRYTELEHRIQMLAVPAHQVVTRRAVLRVWTAMFLMLTLILAGIVGITVDTNRAINTRASLRDQNDALEETIASLEAEIDELEAADSQAVVSLHERNDELEDQIADYEIVVAQAVAGFRAWCEYIRGFGEECPTIELNPALGMPPTPEADG